MLGHASDEGLFQPTPSPPLAHPWVLSNDLSREVNDFVVSQQRTDPMWVQNGTNQTFLWIYSCQCRILCSSLRRAIKPCRWDTVCICYDRSMTSEPRISMIISPLVYINHAMALGQRQICEYIYVQWSGHDINSFTVSPHSGQPPGSNVLAGQPDHITL